MKTRVIRWMIVIKELSAEKRGLPWLIMVIHLWLITNVNTVLNSLPNDKILGWSKFKALGDDKINVAEKLEFAIRWVETFWEKQKMLFKLKGISQNVFKTWFFKGR